MIQILSVYPYLQKVVRGTTDEDGQFYSEHVTYQVMGDGMQCADYIKQEDLAYQVMSMLGSDARDFLEPYQSEVLEIAKHNNLDVRMYEDETLIQTFQEDFYTSDSQQLKLYALLAKSQIQTQDVCIISDANSVPAKDLQVVFQSAKDKGNIVVGVIKAKQVMELDVYSNVLVLAYEDVCDTYQLDAMEEDTFVALAKELHKYARILVLAMKNNRILVSVENQMYYGTCKVKDESEQVYLGAIAAGIALCYEQEGDIYQFIQECLSRNVASSLSSGIFAGSKDTVQLIKEKIVSGKLENR